MVMDLQMVKQMAKKNCDVVLSLDDHGSSLLKSIYSNSSVSRDTALISYMAWKLFVVCRFAVNACQNDKNSKIVLDAILDELDTRDITLPSGIKITSDTLTQLADSFAEIDKNSGAQYIPSAFFGEIEPKGSPKIATHEEKIEFWKTVKQDTKAFVFINDKPSGNGCFTTIACLSISLLSLICLVF